MLNKTRIVKYTNLTKRQKYVSKEELKTIELSDMFLKADARSRKDNEVIQS